MRRERAQAHQLHAKVPLDTGERQRYGAVVERRSMGDSTWFFSLLIVFPLTVVAALGVALLVLLVVAFWKER